VPRYTNKRACDLKGLQEVIHVSRLSFFTHACTRNFFVSSLKERVYTYSMYLSTVKVGSDYVEDKGMKSLPLIRSPTLLDITRGSRYTCICRARDIHVSRTYPEYTPRRGGRVIRRESLYPLCRPYPDFSPPGKVSMCRSGSNHAVRRHKKKMYVPPWKYTIISTP
jgi:hypothetical protein